MKLPAFSIQRPVTTLMVSVAMVLFGWVAYKKLPLTLMPGLSYPTFVVETTLSGASPEEMENLITRPIEEALGILPGIRELKSRSRQGISQVVLSFHWGTNLPMATLDIREKLDLLVLPEEASQPLILRYDPLSDPMMRLGFHGKVPLSLLRSYAEKVIKRNLEGIPGVAAAKVLGGLTQEIQVIMKPERLRQLNVTFEAVENALHAHNINVAGGSLYEGEVRYTVRAFNPMVTPQDVEEVPLPRVGATPLLLKDVAQVRWGYERPEALARSIEGSMVELAIYREGDANMVEVSRRVQAFLKNHTLRLPKNTQVSLLFDASQYIQNALNEVRSNAIVGGLIALLVILAFLGNLRTTLVVGLSIPISILITFFLMHQFHITLNIMSLGGLALGVGMLVDNAIVVIEAIDRKIKDGLKARDAAIQGAGEVSGAITASTLTTVVVFAPVLFLKGFTAQLFRDEALTVTFALLSSLFVALSLIPMLSAYIRLKQGKITLFPKKLPGGYSQILKRQLRKPGRIVLVFLILFALSLWLGRTLPTDLIPPLHQGTLILHLTLPPGTPIETTDKTARALLEKVQAYPAVKKAFATSGRWQRGSQPEEERGENTSEIYFLLEGNPIEKVETRFIQKIKTLLAQMGIEDYTFSQPTLLRFSTPVEIQVFGPTLEAMAEGARKIKAILEKQPFISDVQARALQRSPELQVHFQPEKLAFYGFTLQAMATMLRRHLEGAIATTLDIGEEEIHVRLKTHGEAFLNLQELENLPVGIRENKEIRLKQVASVVKSLAPAEIQRTHQERVITLTANLRGMALSRGTHKLKEALSQVELPIGVTARLSGAEVERRESLQALLWTFLLAVFCVYVVMASQFESLIHPFIILFTVPMGLMGAFLILFITHTSLSIIAIIGMVMLAGIVVNNAIVMVDKANQLRQEGLKPLDAITRAAEVRLRPILMTAFTTILGLLPLSLGLGPGAELKAPLGLTVIGGLSLATFLTLFFIPALYIIASHPSDA